MITIRYFKTENLPENEIHAYLGLLPDFMQERILKYKNPEDRKSRIIARIMLKQELAGSGANLSLQDWQLDPDNKPFVKGWDFFNISYAKGFVILAQGDEPLGIDMERRDPMNHLDLAGQLHARDQHFILTADNPSQAFYDIWVKKEAFLKAIGTGLISEPAAFDCMGGQVQHLGKDWYFHNIQLHPEYSTCLCTSSGLTETKLAEFDFPQRSAALSGQSNPHR